MDLVSIIINRCYLTLDRRGKRWIFRAIDLVLFPISIFVAFVLRFDFFQALVWLPEFKEQIYLFFPIKLGFFWIVGVYRPVLRYTGLEFLGTAFVACVGSTGLIALTWLLFPISPMPRSILILDSIITLLLMISVRLIIRWFVYRAVMQVECDKEQERVVVYGAGEAGSQLVQALLGQNRFKVIGFVDDNSQLKDQTIHGVKVYSPKKLPDLVRKHDVDSILLAIISAGKQRKREVVDSIQNLGVQIKTIPSIGEIVSGRVSISEIRNIDIVDLLGREEVEPDQQLLKENITGKSVLVTGAGGSIGSELCRQITTQKPDCLILFELNEFALYNIDIELKDNFPGINVVPYLGSVLNQRLLEKIITIHNVKTIFHAAAYKHVPLIESNIAEGVLNNVKGTLTCVQVANNCCVDTFVLISTDKAVRPTNVMGTTKRISELILQSFSQRDDVKTRFVMVRFGNVLDSAGSVVPRFRKQILEGKNITITHKEINRYFMSIPEASRLVIQAGALGNGGEVFLLDMGDPVKIYDLAIQMIELSGLTLGEDIDIEFTGLRPGEKLFEELFINHKNSVHTSHPKIFCAKEQSVPGRKLEKCLDHLFQIVEDSNDQEILSALKKLVPEFSQTKQMN